MQSDRDRVRDIEKKESMKEINIGIEKEKKSEKYGGIEN